MFFSITVVWGVKGRKSVHKIKTYCLVGWLNRLVDNNLLPYTSLPPWMDGSSQNTPILLKLFPSNNHYVFLMNLKTYTHIIEKQARDDDEILEKMFM